MQYVRILITVLIILAIYYFAEWQRKSQEKETKKMQNDIKVGDKIVTYTGLSGTVSEVLEDRVILETNPNKIELSIEKWAIAGLDDRATETGNDKNNKADNKTKEQEK